MICKRLAILCTDTVDRVVRLDAVRDPVGLCGACIDYARRQGMNPSDVPSWLARGVTGENKTVELRRAG